MTPWDAASDTGTTAPFGQALRRARTGAALSQEQLAERAGLSARGVSDLERGLHRTPRLETVRLLADALALEDDERAALIAAARPSPRETASASAWAAGAAVPAPPTRIIGRERELASIARAVRGDGVRLLTLTGPGGSGKTRLAIAAATTLADCFPDSAVFVDLASLTHPAMIPATVAQAFGLRELGGREPSDILAAVLAGKRILLLLDNFEHLVEGAPFVAALLGALPGLTVLATSREPLRLRGERTIPAPPLSLPPPEHSADLAEVARSEAVTLFVERARDARCDFTLSEMNAADVAAICQRLDGLPLALELAAPHLRVLTMPVLCQLLAQPLMVLTAGPRDAPPRQRTLRDTIAWSYNLLTAAEQRLFRALGVFVGGWTLDAAEAVAEVRRQDGETARRQGEPEGCDPALASLTPAPDHPLTPSPSSPATRHPPPSTFALIASLVEKQLVRVSDEAGEPRYAMLETIREFAREQLAASGEMSAVQERHAAWCLALTERAELALEGFGGEQARWLARMDTELGNYRAALAWFRDTGDARRLLRMVTIHDSYWYVRPYEAEALDWLELGLRHDHLPIPVRVPALTLAADLATMHGDQRRALRHAEEGVLAARDWGDPFRLGRVLGTLGTAWKLSGDLERAEPCFAEALACMRHAAAASWIYLMLSDLGSTRLLRGDLPGALPLLDEAVALVRAHAKAAPGELQDLFGLTQVLITRAHGARAAGDAAAAARLLAESLASAQAMRLDRVALGAIAGLAGLALDRGEPERAAWLLGAVAARQAAAGVKVVYNALHAERIVSATRAALGGERFATIWREGLVTPYDAALADAFGIAAEAGDAEAGSRWPIAT